MWRHWEAWATDVLGGRVQKRWTEVPNENWFPISGPIVTLCLSPIDIQKLHVLPTLCIYVFCMDLRTNRLFSYIAGFLNRRATARYRAQASIIPGRERPEETKIRYKISLVQLITNLNVILYLSKRHTVYISVLILFMIMP